MCGITSAKLGSKDVEIFLGYSGGEFSIKGNVIYSSYGQEDNNSAPLKHILSQNTKEELIDMIIQFVENAMEA